MSSWMSWCFETWPSLDAHFRFEGKNSSPLTFLEAAPRDGGTDLWSRFDSGHDYEVLVTDGLDTLTDRLPESKRPPLHPERGRAREPCDASPPRPNQRRVYFNLQTATDDEAAQALVRGSLLSSITTRVRSPMSRRWLLAGSSNGGRVAVTGRLLRAGSRDHHPVRFRTVFPVPAVRDSSGGGERRRLIPTFWAQQRVTELSVFADRNRAQLLALGRSFGIVTPGASCSCSRRWRSTWRHRAARQPGGDACGIPAQVVGRRGGCLEKRRKAKSVLGDVEDPGLPGGERSFPLTVRTFVSRTSGKAGDAGGVEEGSRAASREESFVSRWCPLSRVLGLPFPARTRPSRSRPRLRCRTLSSASVGRMSGSTASDPDGPATSSNPGIRTPYLRAITQAGRGRAYVEFLTQRITHGDSPAFFLDCADYFLKAGERALAARVLTDIAELRLEEPQLLRVVAHRLQQIEEFDLVPSSSSPCFVFAPKSRSR